MNTEKILREMTEDGFLARDYMHLCELTDEKVKNGKSKALHLEEFSRHMKFRKIEGSKKFLITKVYDRPMLKEDSRSVYMQNIQLIMLNYIKDNGNSELTKNDILNICGMCNQRYLDKNYKYLLDEFNIDEFNIKDFYRRTILKFSEIIDAAIFALGKNSYCYAVVRKAYKIIQGETNWIADIEEEKIIEDVKRKVLTEMGLNNMRQVYQKFLQVKFFNSVNIILSDKYGWGKCFSIYQIYPTSKIEENIEHFIKNALEINVEKKILNCKLVDYFNNDAKNKFDKNAKKVKLATDKIFDAIQTDDDMKIKETQSEYKNIFTLNDMYVDYQKIITKYLLEI
jgi:hypothetical protein